MKKPALDRFRLDNTTHVVDPMAKLGAGSEGMVIKHPRDDHFCLKLYHPVEPGDTAGERVAAYRDRKIRAITGLKVSLPPQFVLPRRPVFDLRGTRVVGYEMSRVPADFHKLRMLLDDSFRTNHQMGLAAVARLYADLFEDLAVVHRSGLVVGDVNLGCIMFQPGGGRAWVDTDSWSYPGFPCAAITELYAHPDLYANLPGSGVDFVSPLPHHDRFSFLVAFIQAAIMGAHPFRMGSHPKARGVQKRASAGITIFDSDVKVPTTLGSLDTLSDELIELLVDRLKRRTDTAIDPGFLRAFADEVTNCGKCGTDYHSSRQYCPQCREVTMVHVPQTANFLIEELFAVPGTLLFAQVIDSNLYLICRTGGLVQVIRIDAKGARRVLTPALPNVSGARYRFFADYVAVCPEPAKMPAVINLYRVDGDTLTQLDSTLTGVLEGESAVFDTSSRFLYRTATSALVKCELFGAEGVLVSNSVADVYQQQSWFTVDRTTGADREVIFGFDRALQDWQWFVIHGNAAGTKFLYNSVDGLDLRSGETVTDFAVYFSASSVLLARQTSYRGRAFVRYAIIGLDGKVHLHRLIGEDDATYAYWENLRGKLHQGKSVLHVTPDGIVKQDFTSEKCTTLLGTATGMRMGDHLTRINGAVGIVRSSGVYVLRQVQK